jgi:putative PEP-CTERM system histidine kinase
MTLGSNGAAVAYGLCGLLFLPMAIQMAIGWWQHREGGLLLAAVVVTLAWAVLLALAAPTPLIPTPLVWTAEGIRSAVWVAFLARALEIIEAKCEVPRQWFRPFAAVVTLVCLVCVGLAWFPDASAGGWAGPRVQSAALALLAVVGLTLVEQLYRNARMESRRSIGSLCLAVGGMFACDFVLYTNTAVFGAVNIEAWVARGVLFAAGVPLVAVSAARNPQWAVDVFVSRGLVLHTATLLGASGYVVVMSVAGFYIGEIGGHWGTALQLTFVLAAVALLFVLVWSGHVRARIKVVLSKHFFRSKYDYRGEWLRLTRTLSAGSRETSIYERAIRALAELMECRGGALWMHRDTGHFVPVLCWHSAPENAEPVPADDPLLAFMQRHEWVVVAPASAIETEPERYGEQETPQWLRRVPGAWLVIPMMHEEQLCGFMILVEPRARIQLNWEDVDLLKTTARQATAFLIQFEAVQALAVARQFEAFNRMSAFVVHDLKTLIAQLTLVVRNARRHRNNAEFMDDAIDTLEHSVKKMNLLMQQLRSAAAHTDEGETDLAESVRDAVHSRRGQCPVPVADLGTQSTVSVRGDSERLALIIGHVIKNAQDATTPDGSVRVRLYLEGDKAIVQVADNGMGMDVGFIRERLFRPFDTTKGVTGMGIGAYEVREYVRANGGDVQVSSRPGHGTSIRLVFPRLRGDLTTPRQSTITALGM